MKIGYARVSTEDQSLQLQLDALQQAGCEKVFKDHGVSGALSDRKGLDQALRAINTGDVLLVWKLDRLGRSLRFLIDLIEDLREKEIGFQSLSDGINTTTPGGELVFHIIGAIAQFERSLISERTRAGMESARKQGKHVGRPHLLSEEQVAVAHTRIIAGRSTISRMASSLGCSCDTLTRAFSRFGLDY